MRLRQWGLFSFLFTLCIATALAQSGTPASTPLRVGAARVDITPAAAPGSPAPTYEHERLYVRAIVLDNGTTRAALIGADQGGLAEDVWAAASKDIAAELNAPVSNIVMSATHTHSSAVTGPGQRAFGAAAAPAGRGAAAGAGGGRGAGAGPAPAPAAASNAPAPAPPLAGQILQAVRQAKAALQPARVGFGTGVLYLNVNRDAIDPATHQWTQGANLQGMSDKTLAVLKFESLSGAPIAVYFNYGMHAITAYLSGVVTADFPGAASRYIEQAYDDRVVAVFTQNASGDQNPLYVRPGTNLMASRTGVAITGNVLTREPVEAPLRNGEVPSNAGDPKVRDRLLRFIESEGQLIGEEVIRVMTNTTRLDSQPRIRGAQKTITCPGRTKTGGAREGGPGTYGDGPPVDFRVGAITIGNIAVTSVNAELYAAFGLGLKSRSPLANTMMVTFANGRANSGYVPDDASFGHYTFQALGSRVQPGCAESSIVDGLTGMIDELK